MEIGKRYLVPAVRVERWHDKFTGWMPVIGSAHEDREFINFPAEHFHIDWRFAPTRAHGYAGAFYGSHVFATVCQLNESGYAARKIVVEGPVMRRMSFKREWPDYPHSRARWLPRLQEAMKCLKATNGICPHRGLPLKDGIVRDDVVTCPGHGLRWRVDTWELVTDTGTPPTSEAAIK